MAPPGLNRARPGGGVRQARHHAANGSPGSRSSDPGPASLVLVNHIGSGTGINLEHIKAIITAQEVLLMNYRDPSVVPFVEELQRRILCHYQATKAQEGNVEDSNWTNLYDLAAPQSRTSSPQNFSVGFPQYGGSEERREDEQQTLENQDGSKVLPFEFVALEACLEAACN